MEGQGPETAMRGFWLQLLVKAVQAMPTASSSHMIKSKKNFESSKPMSHRNPPTVASPSLFGDWLTDTVTYHH